VIQALISFGLSILVARHLGVDQFGVYAIATSAGFFITILLDGGFITLLQRESARASLGITLEGQILSRYALGYTFLVLVALMLMIIINPFSQHVTTLVAIVFAFSPIVLIGQSMSVLRGRGRLARDALLQVITRFLTAFCVVAFIFYGLDSPASVLFAQGVGGYVVYFILAFRSKIKPLFLILNY
jgi:O-antigen/teichoic acid export membrane protein